MSVYEVISMQSKHILPPGPKGLPVLGNVLQFRHDQLGYLLKLEQTYGRMDNYADMIVQYTRETVERWQPGAEIDIARDLQTLILRMIMKILVDIDLVEQDSEVSHIIDAVLEQPVGLLEGLLNVQIDLP